MANENKIPEIIRSSLENIRSMVDANTVVGEPISTAPGTTIIPISKVSVGFAGGGNDYAGKNAQASGKNNFGGAGGSGVTVKPVGAPSFVASSEKEYWVFATQTGSLSYPLATRVSICFFA